MLGLVPEVDVHGLRQGLPWPRGLFRAPRDGVRPSTVTWTMPAFADAGIVTERERSPGTTRSVAGVEPKSTPVKPVSPTPVTTPVSPPVT
jgi:DNA-binding transcriptional ArsR family regulator